MGKYLGKGLLLLSISSQFLEAASESSYTSRVDRDFTDSDIVAKEIMGEGSWWWNTKASVFDVAFRGIYSSERNTAQKEDVIIDDWVDSDRSLPHPLAPQQGKAKIVPFSEIAGFPIEGVWTSEEPPEQDKSFVKRVAAKVLAATIGTFELDTDNSPKIPIDNDVLLSLAFPKKHRALLEAPHMPDALKNCGNDVIGACALSGPFTRYLRKASEEESRAIPFSLLPTLQAAFAHESSVYVMGLPEYADFAVKPGLETLGGEAYLSFDGNRMRTFAIKYQDRWVDEASTEWGRMQKIVMATLGTDITVVQHLLNTHLLIAGTFSAVTENLDPKHPLRVFLHPHSLATVSINNYNVPILVRKGAMFETLYSYEQENMARLFNTKVSNFDIRQMDIHKDIERRGMSGFPFSYATSEKSIWDTIRTYTAQYINAYYASDSNVTADQQIVTWYNDLKRYIPNDQIAVYAPTLTKESLINLVTLYSYTASVNHDLVGVMTYHYLPWMNHIPSKVNIDGTAPSVGVLKLAANLLLATQPTSLSTMVHHSFSKLALDTKGEEIISQLRLSLEEFQVHLERVNLDLLDTTQPKKLIPSVHS